jgi:hypothetical protein
MKPVDAAQDVSQGRKVSVTLPLSALVVLTGAGQVKGAELSDAQLLLQAELASIGKRY